MPDILTRTEAVENLTAMKQVVIALENIAEEPAGTTLTTYSFQTEVDDAYATILGFQQLTDIPAVQEEFSVLLSRLRAIS